MSRDPAPTLSVLVPCFNQERFIQECIDSILSQDYQDFELLISDDASCDATAAIVSLYEDKRIAFFRNDRRRGMVNHWNWLLAKARGRYVKFVFGDDVLVSKGALGLMVAALDSRQDVGLVFSERLLINSSSESTGLAETFKRRGLYTGKDLIFECLSQQKNLIGEPTAVMFRSEIASRGFDPRYSQLVDLEMWAFLTLEATAIFIDEPLVAFRLHENQQTNVNLKISGLSEREMLSLFFCYWREGGYRHARIIVAYKRALRKSDSETQALCDRLTHAAKPHFLFLCYVASLDRALRRPFQNLARFVRRFFSKTSLLKR